jgi:hypothetical protein
MHVQNVLIKFYRPSKKYPSGDPRSPNYTKSLWWKIYAQIFISREIIKKGK